MTMRGEKHGLYTVTCLTNGKVYVGRSRRPAIRLRSHKVALQGGYHIHKEMQADYWLHGMESFEFVVINDCIDGMEIHDAEAKLAHMYRNKGKAYNVNIRKLT